MAWVQEAVARARAKHPELPDGELESLCSAAVSLAASVARDEREFFEAFEAELQRGVEERAVLGTAGSVLPSASSDGSGAPSILTADGEDERSARAEPARREPAAADEPAQGPGPRLERGLDYVLAAGTLRFHHGMDPSEIETELGIDRDYYTRCVQWLLGQVESTLGGEYTSHVNRAEMAAFAAGLLSIEQAFALERHVRECRSCTEYLTDLLDGAVASVDPASDGGEEKAEGRSAAVETSHAASAEAEALPPPLATRQGRTSYTTDDTWAALSKRAREKPAVPFMRLKAQSLRRYMPPADPAVDVSEDLLDTGPIPRRARSHARRPVTAAEHSSLRPEREVVARLRERRALIDRLPLLPGVPAVRRGYATAFMALFAGLSVVEGGAAVTGQSSPVLTVLDKVGDEKGSGGPQRDDAPVR
ncbi:MAG: hypothetical protein ACRDL0_08595, partial [Thermoleophilaceae bacterium]